MMWTRTMPRLFTLSSLAILFCAFSGGCGSGHPETFPVAGKITYDGQPVTQGTVVFYPEEGQPAMGTIAADGSYRLTTFEDGDGAAAGASYGHHHGNCPVGFGSGIDGGRDGTRHAWLHGREHTVARSGTLRSARDLGTHR